MDFSAAFDAVDVAARNELIELQINEFNWDNELTVCMSYGGSPAKAYVDSVTIHEDGEDLVALAEISFLELVSSDCKDYSQKHRLFATFEIRGYRESGRYDIELRSQSGSPNDFFLIVKSPGRGGLRRHLRVSKEFLKRREQALHLVLRRSRLGGESFDVPINIVAAR